MRALVKSACRGRYRARYIRMPDLAEQVAAAALKPGGPAKLVRKYSTYTLLAVLIVVLGGVNPNGGSGRLSGVILAIIVLQVLSSLLNTFPDISNFYRPLIWGGVLLLVIVVNELSNKGSLARLLKWKGNQS